MNEVVDFLAVVMTQLEKTHVVYKKYIESGKIFLYANILKKINDELRDLLVNKGHLLPVEQSKNALALIHHIDVWSVIWDDAFSLFKPTDLSVFAFKNDVNFPTKEVESLIDFYKTVSSSHPRTM